MRVPRRDPPPLTARVLVPLSGNDARGFEVIYSCSARAANLEPQDGVHHIVCTLERVLRHNTMSKLCWIVDFNGFGWRHTDPRAGVAVVRALSAHYPERLGEVVLLNAPTVFWSECTAGPHKSRTLHV